MTRFEHRRSERHCTEAVACGHEKVKRVVGIAAIDQVRVLSRYGSGFDGGKFWMVRVVAHPVTVLGIGWSGKVERST